MTIWLDNHLSPTLANWIASAFGEDCTSIRDMGMARASDRDIFAAARSVGAVIVTKDRDFAELVARHGPPPQIVLLTCGNTTNNVLQTLLGERLAALARLKLGDALVEIG